MNNVKESKKIMKKYTTPYVILLKVKEDVVTASDGAYIVDNFDDLSEWTNK